MFRRKRMPDHLAEPWEAFSAQAARVEGARRALIGCLPVGRVEPAPVPVGLDLLRDELRAVSTHLDRWKVDEVAGHWEACSAAIAEALDQVEPAREIAETTDEMQHVVEAVAEIADALDPWYDAERYWLTLRVR
jgi:hypothetical protein